MSDLVTGFIEKKETGWFFRIGNHEDKMTHNDEALQDLETCYEKMKEYKFNEKAHLVALVGTPENCVSYELYKQMP